MIRRARVMVSWVTSPLIPQYLFPDNHVITCRQTLEYLRMMGFDEENPVKLALDTVAKSYDFYQKTPKELPAP